MSADPIGLSVATFHARLEALGLSYDEYLASPHWLTLRDRFRGEPCALCGEPMRNLHHTTYDRLGDERDGDLLPLCLDHHQMIHRYAQRRELTIATASVAVRHSELKRQRAKRQRAAHAQRFVQPEPSERPDPMRAPWFILWQQSQAGGASPRRGDGLRSSAPS